MAAWLALFAIGCSTSSDGLPKLAKFGESIPEVPIPVPLASEQPPAPTVDDVSKKGCTTVVVKGLSEQIIAEGNCLVPGAYSRVPDLSAIEWDKSAFPYMKEPARDALVEALDGAKHKLKVNSMLRTVAQQYLLYDWYRQGRCGITLAAAPGTSNHQTGLAIDVSSPKRWRRKLTRHGFRWLGKKDRWHFDYVADDVDHAKGLDMKAFQRLWNRNHPSEPISEDGDWGESTEKALRRAPADGFPIGATCG